MNREILRLAVPNILSNISIPLLSTVDTALMGRLSEGHLGAVGLGAMAFNFIYWNFGFLRMGTTGITAQYFGADNRKAIVQTLGRALVIALGLGVLMIVLQRPLAAMASYLLNVDESMIALLNDYFNIRIWAAPATLGLYALLGWFFGMQNAVYPLLVTILLNAINMVVSYVLVAHFNMEIQGVAIGTVVAQYCGFLLALGLMVMRYRDVLSELILSEVMELKPMLRFLKVNFDILIRTLFLTIAFGFFYNQSSTFGETMLAVNVILLQYVNWMSYAIDGFAFATESVVGKYTGAVDIIRTKRAIGLNFIWGGVVAGLFSLVYFLFGAELLYVFTDQKALVDAAIPYLKWMALIPILGYPSYIWDGVYIGLTASRSMRNSMAVAFVLFLAAYYGLLKDFQNHGLWMALIFFLAVRGVLQYVLYLKDGLRLH